MVNGKKVNVLSLLQLIMNNELGLSSLVIHLLFDHSALILFHRPTGYGQKECFALAPNYIKNIFVAATSTGLSFHVSFFVVVF